MKGITGVSTSCIECGNGVVRARQNFEKTNRKKEALDADADLANETIQVIFREVLLGRTNIVDTYTQKKIIKFYPHVHHDSFSLKAQQFHVYKTSRNISFCKIIG